MTTAFFLLFIAHSLRLFTFYYFMNSDLVGIRGILFLLFFLQMFRGLSGLSLGVHGRRRLAALSFLLFRWFSWGNIQLLDLILAINRLLRDQSWLIRFHTGLVGYFFAFFGRLSNLLFLALHCSRDGLQWLFGSPGQLLFVFCKFWDVLGYASCVGRSHYRNGGFTEN